MLSKSDIDFHYKWLGNFAVLDFSKWIYVFDDNFIWLYCKKFTTQNIYSKLHKED